MSEISINNGLSYHAAHEVIDEILSCNLWNIIVESMDDEIRERVHHELAPCTELEFLERYLELSESDFIAC